MKCLYCHEDVQPSGDTCPQCGLPMVEDTTMLELGGPQKPTLSEWMAERKSVLLAAAGGFVAAVAIGVLLISTYASAQPSEANQAITQPPAPTVQMASRNSGSPFGSTQVTPAPLTPEPPQRLAPAPAPAPAPAAPAAQVTPVSTPAPGPAPTATAAVATAPASVEPENTDISEPPPLPDNFEYDPQWGFAPPPKPARRPKKRPDPVLEPTPPGHVLAMNPNRSRGPQFVTIVPNRGTVGQVGGASGSGVTSLPSFTGE